MKEAKMEINGSNNVVGNNNTITYAIDIEKLKQELNAQSQQEINELKATIRAMEEARQKNPNPSELYDRAYQLLQKGDIDDALQTLNDETLNEQSKQVTDEFILKSKQIADEFILKAQMLTLIDRYQETETCYVKAIEIYPSFETFLAIGNYYYRQRNYDKAERYYEDCLAKAQNENEKAAALNGLAILHSDTNQHKKAAVELVEALTIYRRLAKGNPEAYEPDVAMTLNNLALLHSKTNKHDAAAAEYAEALTIYRRLAKGNPEAHEPDVAMTLNNLAILHRKTNKHEAAAEEYAEALTIRRRLAQRNPEAYEPNVANTLNNLAALHCTTDKYEEAIKEVTEALTIYRRLAERNPEAYEPDLAKTLNNLAILHGVTNQHKKAIEAATEALTIYEKFAKTSPTAYQPDVDRCQWLLQKLKQ
jgi:tetratricopeptide (TPR) repeat protein